MRFTDENGISYELNEKDLTGQVVWSLQASGTITIPRSVFYDSKEYLIISIHSGAFQRNHSIKEISFPENSEVRLIESRSFSSSSLEKLSLPKSIQKLEDGWNGYLPLKFEITLPPDNPYFQYYKNQLLIAQSTENEKNAFDSIIFVNRCIQKVKIPSFVRKICSFAFSRCKNLISIDFNNDSNLCEIENFAFYQSSISHAIIPRKACEIGQYAFHECVELVSIEFLCDGQLEFGYSSFQYNHKLKLISCPNAKCVCIDKFIGCYKNMSLFLVAGTEYKKL